MIDPATIAEAKRLLAQGELSQRKIAKRLGISRATIGAIAHGKRPDYEPRSKPEDELPHIAGPPRRCPGCGGLVWFPCQLCRVQREQQREARLQRARQQLARGELITAEMARGFTPPRQNATDRRQQENSSGWATPSGG